MFAGTLVPALHDADTPLWGGGYTPTERQAEFHAAADTEVLYGGAAGGGKSEALLRDAIRFLRTHAGETGCIVRRYFTDLRDEFLYRARLMDEEVGAHYHGGDQALYFSNGSRLLFRHCRTEEEALRFRSVQMGYLGIEEATELSFRQFERIRSRLRSPRQGVTVRARLTSNPGGEGHVWVKERYVDGPERYIPARVGDMAGVLPEYAESYAALLGGISDEAERRALLEGDWDILAGQFFRAFRRERHVYRPGATPGVDRHHDAWPVYLALDYGETAPVACLWAAVDPGQSPPRIWVYREHVKPRLTWRQHLAEIKAASEGEEHRLRVADPSIFPGRDNPHAAAAPANQANAAGLAFQPGYNSRVPGWAAIREALAIREDGQPGLLISEACPVLIAQLPAMQYDPRNPDDAAERKGEADKPAARDDAVDALRYLCAAVAGLSTGQGRGSVAGGSTAKMIADRRRAFA